MGGQVTAIIQLKGYPDEENHIKGSTVWLKVVSPLPKEILVLARGLCVLGNPEYAPGCEPQDLTDALFFPLMKIDIPNSKS